MTGGKPVVLCFSGLDPSGGAGLQADIETLHSLGCHCAPVVTTLTVQDTANASRAAPVAVELMLEQARAVLADLRVRCFKLGLIGAAGAARAIGGLLREHREIPVVLDPVSAAGGGYAFSGAEALAALRESVLPLVTVATPNTGEAMQLAPAADSPDSAAAELVRAGCGHVLLTGGHEDGAEVVNRWHRGGVAPVAFHWPRLERAYHGSGCTLAAAIAGNLALGRDVEDALRQAQRFTWHALSRGWRAGAGQYLPDRSALAADTDSGP